MIEYTALLLTACIGKNCHTDALVTRAHSEVRPNHCILIPTRLRAGRQLLPMNLVRFFDHCLRASLFWRPTMDVPISEVAQPVAGG